MMNDFSDYEDERLEKEIKRSRQTDCENFYRYIDSFQNELMGIKNDSPSFNAKTSDGNRKITFGQIGVCIQYSNPLEAIYFFYDDLNSVPSATTSSSPNKKKNNIYLALLCALLGLVISNWFFLGTIIFLVEAFSGPRFTISILLRDDTGKHVCTYYLRGVSNDDTNKFFTQLNQGIGMAIKYNEWRIEKLLDEESENDIVYLNHLKENLKRNFFNK